MSWISSIGAGPDLHPTGAEVGELHEHKVAVGTQHSRGFLVSLKSVNAAWFFSSSQKRDGSSVVA